MIKKIILTAPHVVCRNPTRDCDRRARDALTVIQAKLQAKGFMVTSLLGDQYRRVYDLNRRPSRVTSWRKELSQEMQNSVKEYGAEHVMLLDIHSFPEASDEYAGENGKNPAIALITYDERFMELRDRLDEALIHPVNIFKAAPRFDIVTEAHDLGIAACLIEHHEDTKFFLEDELMHYADVLVNFLGRWIEVKTPGNIQLPSRRPGPEEMKLFSWIVSRDFFISWTVVIAVILIAVFVFWALVG